MSENGSVSKETRKQVGEGESAAAKASLIARKLLNAAGALTIDGKNAGCGQYDLYNVPARNGEFTHATGTV